MKRAKIHDGLKILGDRIERLNQLIVVFPVWLVLGISGMLRRAENEKGWQESEENRRYGRLY